MSTNQPSSKDVTLREIIFIIVSFLATIMGIGLYSSYPGVKLDDRGGDASRRIPPPPLEKSKTPEPRNEPKHITGEQNDNLREQFAHIVETATGRDAGLRDHVHLTTKEERELLRWFDAMGGVTQGLSWTRRGAKVHNPGGKKTQSTFVSILFPQQIFFYVDLMVADAQSFCGQCLQTRLARGVEAVSQYGERQGLACYLMEQRIRGADSPWSPLVNYWKAFPPRSGLANWGVAELAMLQDFDLFYEGSVERPRSDTDEFNHAFAFPSYCVTESDREDKAEGTLAPHRDPSAYTFELFRWALGVIETCGFRIALESKKNSPRVVLLPFLHTIRRTFNSTAVAEPVAETLGGMQIRWSEPANVHGSELTIQLGNVDGLNSLRSIGYAAFNPFDAVTVNIRRKIPHTIHHPLFLAPGENGDLSERRKKGPEGLIEATLRAMQEEGGEALMMTALRDCIEAMDGALAGMATSEAQDYRLYDGLRRRRGYFEQANLVACEEEEEEEEQENGGGCKPVLRALWAEEYIWWTRMSAVRFRVSRKRLLRYYRAFCADGLANFQPGPNAIDSTLSAAYHRVFVVDPKEFVDFAE